MPYALLSAAIFASVAWLAVIALVYIALYGSFIFCYLLVWTPAQRKEMCPKGLFHTLFHE